MQWSGQRQRLLRLLLGSGKNVCDQILREVEERLMRMGGPVKVMTDDQIHLLRRQISMFGIICEQLVEMHKAVTARQDAIAGTSLGSQYCDPMMIPGDTPRVSTRQRWTPTSLQLQILERIFMQDNGTPSKQRTKEIASELLQHGPISETNVYNWFQNRRARSKRKQAAAAARLSIESEAEMENECSKVVMKGKTIGFFQSPEGSSDLQSVHPNSMKNPGMTYISNDSIKSLGSIGELSLGDSVVLNPSIGKVQSVHPNSMKNPGMSCISNVSIKSAGNIMKVSFCDSGILNPSIDEVQSMHPDSMKNPGMSHISNDSIKSSGSIGKVSFCDSGVFNPRVNQVMRVQIPEGLSYFQHGNKYDMSG